MKDELNPPTRPCPTCGTIRDASTVLFFPLDAPPEPALAWLCNVCRRVMWHIPHPDAERLCTELSFFRDGFFETVDPVAAKVPMW